MKRCEKCQRDIADDAEICECGAWLRASRASQNVQPDIASTERLPMWIHALLMLGVAPLAWGLMLGVKSGFSFHNPSLILAIAKLFEWFALAFFSLVVSWFTLLFKKPEASWTLLFVTLGLTFYSVSNMEKKQGLDRAAVVQSAPSATHGPQAPADKPTAGFVRVQLPRKVEVQLPAGWRVLNREQTELVSLSADSAVELMGNVSDSEGELNLVSAVSTPANTYAAVRIDSFLPPSMPPQKLVRATSKEIADREAEQLPLLEQMMALQGNQLIGAIAVSRENYSGFPALVTRYRRTGPQGVVSVCAIQIMTDRQEIIVTFSYRESERAIWMPIIEKVRRSIIVGA